VTGFGALIFRKLPNGLADSRRAADAARAYIPRVIPIAVTTWPDEATRTSNSASLWIAEATVEGRAYTARSRHGPPISWRSSLFAAGFPRSADGHPLPWAGRDHDISLVPCPGDVDLQRNESCVASGTESCQKGSFSAARSGKRCVSSSVADDVERPPANGRKAEAPLPASSGWQN
jgi:hypothetical protein